MNIVDYFQQQYGIRLNYPHAPMITSLEAKSNVYPMELCFVRENQRVNKNHMTRDEDAKMIKACAVPPIQQHKQNLLITKALHIDNENEWMKNAEIGVTNSTLKVEARVLQNPIINFANDQSDHQRVDDLSGKWRAGKQFLRPAEPPVWGAYYILANSDRFTDAHFKTFLQAYVKECNKRGLQLSTPAEYCRIENSSRAIAEKIKNVAENNGGFILFITSKTITELHKSIKFYERRYEVVTQDLKLSSVQDIIERGRPQTLENIVQKTNMKLGGLNYSIIITEPGLKDLFGPATLYLGLAMSHPGSVSDYERPRGTSLQYSAPSVIGYAANMMKHPFEFVGDCLYGEPRRDEKVDVISGIVRNCLARFRENRNCDPKRIIIYRNGTSEGQFGLVLQFEIPLIKHALKAENCDANITLIVPTRAHNIRLFEHPIKPSVKSTEQNIKPGTVVDTGIVHPTYCEFYLNSHLALQGSAKTPKYTVLIDDNNLSMDALEGMTHMLSFGHQIVNMPTGLPSPVYIASEYAERGRNLFGEYKREMGRNNETQFTLEKVTARLSYYNSHLGHARINA
uniref:Piwi domain-containing protein n=1 Tax=Acrobeloides nanus TaxID=290746 RepID=A0A914EDZ2_9BILA